ncbi:MAG: divergent PAP2 family protein [Spirochaetia bacterium]
MRTFPIILCTALSTQAACMIFKLLFYSIKEKKVNIKYLFTAGGIPSAHTALVVSLTTAVILKTGINSNITAVSFVFSAIVIYDAFRLRGAVQNHAKLLNRITETYHPEIHQQLNDMLGHSIPEILWGFLFGVTIPILFSIIGII